MTDRSSHKLNTHLLEIYSLTYDISLETSVGHWYDFYKQRVLLLCLAHD